MLKNEMMLRSWKRPKTDNMRHRNTLRTGWWKNHVMDTKSSTTSSGVGIQFAIFKLSSRNAS